MLKYAAWEVRLTDERPARPLMDAGIPYLNALVLAARGVTEPEQALEFCRPGHAPLHDPFLLPDMDRAVSRIRQALERGETIAVYGDYDLDGLTSTVLLYRQLVSMGARCEWFIPERLTEGHGLREDILRQMRERGISLVVTVDTGVTALKEAQTARELGLDVIITDHHEPRDRLPDAVAVVNPKRSDSVYPFSELAGAGVAFKLVCALAGVADAEALKRFAELAALGTVADVAVLRDENRTLVRAGLSALEKTSHPGLAALLKEAARDERITSQTIGFRLAPRLNAAGRLGRADAAMELLLCENPSEGRRIAALLSELNQSRKVLEGHVMSEAAAQIEAGGPVTERGALVLSGDGWHPGVTGIVAGQLAERYGLPVFLTAFEGEEGKGSARGVPGVNLAEALNACEALLEEYGGHMQAAGFRVRRDNFAGLAEDLNAFCRASRAGAEAVSVCAADAAPEPDRFTPEDVRGLRSLEPFGEGNPEPVFLWRDVLIRSAEPIGGGAHVRLSIEAGNRMFSAVWFFVRAEQLPVGEGERADILFTADIHCFRNTESVRLQLRDLRPSRGQLERDEAAWDAYARFCEDAESLEPAQAAQMRPQRQHMGIIWRELTREGTLRGEPLRLARRLSGGPEVRLPPGMVWVTLDILAEYHLIEMEKGSCWQITARQNPDKVDITRSGRLAALDAVIQR